MIGLIDAPTELVQRCGQILQIRQGRGHGPVVVAGLGQGIDAVGVPRANRPVLIAADQKVLRLHADVEDVALLLHIGQHALEIGAGAIRMGLLIDIEIAREARGVRLPGNRRVGIQVDAGEHVMRMRPLPHAPYSGAGETCADVDGVVQTRRRDHLHLRRPGNVHKLHEDELDAVTLQTLANLLPTGHVALLVSCPRGEKSKPHRPSVPAVNSI